MAEERPSTIAREGKHGFRSRAKIERRGKRRWMSQDLTILTPSGPKRLK